MIFTLILAVAGLGVTAYWAVKNEVIPVYPEKVKLSWTGGSVKMNASSVCTRNITVNTSSAETITVRIKVLPGDYSTAKVWGEDFIAFADPSEVDVSVGNDARVTIIHYAEEEGTYKVKVIATT